MSNYDPRRSRPRPVAEPDPEAAPIEALFGPEPDPVPDERTGPEPVADDPANNAKAPSITAEPRRPVPTPRSSAPSPVWQLAPLVAALSALAALVWWFTRRRRN